MAGIKFTTGSQPISDANLNGGLNSTSGPLSLKNTESSDLQNIDFNKFGSIIKRNGYSQLNTSNGGGIDSYTKIILHMDGTNGSTSFLDSSLSPHTVTAINSSKISTAQSVFGGASGLFTQLSNDYVTISADSGLNFGSNNWTIDMRLRWNSNTHDNTIQLIYGQDTGPNGSYIVVGYNPGTNTSTSIIHAYGYDSSGSLMVSSFTNFNPTLNTWYHIAIERYGSNILIFVNGISLTVTDSQNIGSSSFADYTSVARIGSGVGSTPSVGSFDGYIDEFRLSNGIARWTSNFTIPTSAYSVQLSQSDGLHWYEFVSTGAYNSKLVDVSGGKIYKMDSLDGTFDDITGSTTITAGNFCDFENWLNTVYVTNNQNVPFQWTGTGNATQMPAFGSNYYSFKVNSVSASPAVGDTYTNNAITYTITFVSLTSGAGTIIASGSGDPQSNGTLTRATGSGDATISFTSEAANINLTKAKAIAQYNNYLFFANVVVGGITHKSRIVWSNIKDDLTWLATSFIDIAKDDGQQIMKITVLGDRLVVFKERSIYNVFFTGDADIPFTVQESGSNVGTIAQHSVKEIENGLVFLSYDGFYYYDSNNSYKISLQIQNTILSYNSTRLSQARSMLQKNKNRYFCSLPSEGQSNNDTVVVWDWQLNAFSIYKGISAAAMTTVYNSAIDERIYFADYSGYAYRMDTGSDDYPLGVQTAINSYYYTNWKHFDDITDQKGVPNIVIYYQTNNAVLTLVYSYDFESADTYTQTFSTATATDVYGSAIYGTAHYAGIGGGQQRRDLRGRGRVIRVGFKNSNMSEQFQIDGMGSFVHLETNV